MDRSDTGLVTRAGGRYELRNTHVVAVASADKQTLTFLYVLFYYLRIYSRAICKLTKCKGGLMIDEPSTNHYPVFYPYKNELVLRPICYIFISVSPT